MASRPSLCAASKVEPAPMNGSSTHPGGPPRTAFAGGPPGSRTGSRAAERAHEALHVSQILRRLSRPDRAQRYIDSIQLNDNCFGTRTIYIKGEGVEVNLTVNPSGLSYLPGLRLPACTCVGEDHPSPGISRSAPEIDAIELIRQKRSNGNQDVAS